MTIAKILFVSIISALITISLAGPFRIPIPFGAIDVNKNPDGSIDFGANSDINILGYGANSGLNFQTKDGRFISNTGGNVIVKNQNYGSNSSLGVDNNRGLNIDSDVNLGKDKTLHGGLGKEGRFIGDLASTVRESQYRQGIN